MIRMGRGGTMRVRRDVCETWLLRVEQEGIEASK